MNSNPEENIHFDVVASLCREIEDCNINKFLSTLEIKNHCPVLYFLTQKYQNEEFDVVIDLEKLSREFEILLREKAVLMLNLLTGEEFESQITNANLADILKSEVEKLKKSQAKLSKVESISQKNTEELKKEYETFLISKKSLLEDYNIPGIGKNVLEIRKLCAEAKAICLRARLKETESILNKYTKEAVLKIKEKKLKLDQEQKNLKTEIKEYKERLDKYEKLDPVLLKEFKQLKNDVECRTWALEELNRSGRLSSGSLSTPPSNY